MGCSSSKASKHDRVLEPLASKPAASAPLPKELPETPAKELLSKQADGSTLEPDVLPRPPAVSKNDSGVPEQDGPPFFPQHDDVCGTTESEDPAEIAGVDTPKCPRPKTVVFGKDSFLEEGLAEHARAEAADTRQSVVRKSYKKQRTRDRTAAGASGATSASEVESVHQTKFGEERSVPAEAESVHQIMFGQERSVRFAEEPPTVKPEEPPVQKATGKKRFPGKSGPARNRKQVRQTECEKELSLNGAAPAAPSDAKTGKASGESADDKRRIDLRSDLTWAAEGSLDLTAAMSINLDLTSARSDAQVDLTSARGDAQLEGTIRSSALGDGATKSMCSMNSMNSMNSMTSTVDDDMQSNQSINLTNSDAACKSINLMAPMKSVNSMTSTSDGSRKGPILAQADLTGSRPLAGGFLSPPGSLSGPRLSYIHHDFGGAAAVVLDIGGHTSRVGLAGEQKPRLIFPSVTFTTRKTLVKAEDAMELIFQRAFGELGDEVKGLPVLLTEPPDISHAKRESLTQTLFETFDVPSIHFANPGMLALLTTGRRTGLVVDLGDVATHMVPVCDGAPVMQSVGTFNVAGRHLTEYMEKLLNANEKISIDHFPLAKRRQISQGVKDDFANVVLDFGSARAAAVNGEVSNCSYTLPDGEVMFLGSEPFQCPEALFQPLMMCGASNRRSVVFASDDDEERETRSIAQCVFDTIMRCDAKLQKELFSNIVLIGGTSLLDGLQARLYNEVRELVPASTSLNIETLPDRQNAAWMGGAMMATLDWFPSLLFTKEEYEENGPPGIHAHCY